MSRPRYTLTIEAGDQPQDPEGIRRVRGLLKAMFRRHGLRCVTIAPAVDEANPVDTAVAPTGDAPPALIAAAATSTPVAACGGPTP